MANPIPYQFRDFYGYDKDATGAVAPSVFTTLASSVSSSGMTFNGTMTSNGGATVTDKGFIYSSNDSTPTIGEFGVTKVTPHPSTFNTTGSYSRSVSGLSSSTTYYFRAYATNSIGTTYGATQTQSTSASYTTKYTSGPHQKKVFACYQTSTTVIKYTGTFGNGTRVYDNNLNVITNDGWYNGPNASSGGSSANVFYVSSTGYVSNYTLGFC